MKKILLTFDDELASIPKRCLFHNTEDMINWFRSKSDTFTQFTVKDDTVLFTVNYSWQSFATFEYVDSFL